MDKKEMALYCREKKYDLIIKEAQDYEPREIKDADIKMIVAEAYCQGNDTKRGAEWYWSCLEEVPEESGRKLLELYKNTGDKECLEQLAEKMGKLEISRGVTALCGYEALRCRDGEYKEQIAALSEYVSEEYDAWYMLRLVELLILYGDGSIAKKRLRQCMRLFPNTEYSEAGELLLKALEDGNAEQYIKEHSVERYIYQSEQPAVQPALAGNDKEVSSVVQKDEWSGTKKETAKRIRTTSLAEQMKRKRKKKKKYVNEEPISIEERFKEIYGMQEIRNSLGNLYRILQMETERKESDFRASLLKTTHFLISGERGTGKTLLATTIGQLLYDFGIRGDEKAVLIEARELQKNFDSLTQLTDVTLIIENIEKCADGNLNYDQEGILWPLCNLLTTQKDSLSVIITGSLDGMQSLISQEREIRKYICYDLKIPKYTAEELMDIAQSMAKTRQFYFDEETRLYLNKVLRKLSTKPGFECSYAIEQMIDDAVSRMANRLAAMDNYNAQDMVTLKREDFEKDNSDEDKVAQLLAQLEQLTGLGSVKEKIREKINEVVANQEKEERGIAIQSHSSHHLVFYGNPGTGKTTVARIIGSIYYYLGILPEKKLIECSVSDLVAEHVGGTSLKTRAVVDKAIGGVLFIDEAYMLSDSRSQFNADAVAELLKGMEDHRDELMVIMAGYQNAMEEFFKDTNEGLRGRFPSQNCIIFEDYTEDELVKIFKGRVQEAHLKLEDDMDGILRLLMEDKSREDGFQNARGVRNVFEEVCSKMNQRLEALEEKTREDYEYIRREDIENVLGKKEAVEKDKQAYIEELYAMTGLAGVKRELSGLLKEIEANQFYFDLGKVTEPGCMEIGNFFFLGNPGTGKTTVARIFGKILEQIGVLKKKNHFMECTREDFVSKIVGESGEKTKKLVESAYGGILFIDEAYRLYEGDNDTYGKEAVETLMKLMEDNRDKLIVIAAGYTNEMTGFLKANPGLKSRFTNEILFEDYTSQELLSILKKMAQQDHYGLEDECEQPLLKHFDEIRQRPNFGNAREVRTLYQNLQKHMKIRNLELYHSGVSADLESMCLITLQDVENAIGKNQSKENGLEDLLKELDSMIGLQNVKTDIHGLLTFIQGIRRAKGSDVDLAKELDRMHMVFQGAPGTGKTTVARLIGKIYLELGILKRDVFVECDRSTLVGSYVGETEKKTNQKIDEALGGVLFIDEAYALAGSGNDYGKNAIDVLLKRMEDDRHNLLVILAGYTKDMEKLFAMNEGFASRIPNVFTFENYTNTELLEIFQVLVKKENMILNPDAGQCLKEYFEERRKSEYFANAREVGTLFSKTKRIIYQHAGTQGEVKKIGGKLLIDRTWIEAVIR